MRLGMIAKSNVVAVVSAVVMLVVVTGTRIVAAQVQGPGSPAKAHRTSKLLLGFERSELEGGAEVVKGKKKGPGWGPS